MNYEQNFKQFLKGRKDKDMNKTGISSSQANSSKESNNLDDDVEKLKEEEEMRKFFNKTNAEKVTNKEKGSPVKHSTKQKKADTEKNEFTFRDMPESSKESLKIVYHNPIYELPIPTNPKYKNKSIEERAKLLDNYYKKICTIKTRLAKESLRRAPYSKPILASNKCKNSLLKAAGEEDFFEETAGEGATHQFYVSRAGRQIKRKVYTEDEQIDTDSDQDFATQAKKNKSMISSDTKITMDTPYVVQETHSETKSVKTREAAKKPLKIKKSSRSAEIMDILSRQEKSYKKKQEEMAAFEKSLPNDEEDMFTDESPNVENDENLNNKVESTVIESTKSNTEDFDSEDILPGTPPENPILQQYMNRSAELRRTKEHSLSEEKSEEKTRDCPLCGKFFPQSQIEDHAANCGNFDNEVENVPTRKGTPRPSKTIPHIQTRSQMKSSNLFILNEEDMMVDDSPVKETKNEENFVKRRVIPPKPKNKRGPKPKNQEDFDKIEIVSSPASSSNVGKSDIKRSQKTVPSKQSEDSEEGERDCPICGRQFPQSEIEDHAASCDNFETEGAPKEGLKCEVCNRLFQKNTQYEVHVQQCIAARISKI